MSIIQKEEAEALARAQYTRIRDTYLLLRRNGMADPLVIVREEQGQIIVRGCSAAYYSQRIPENGGNPSAAKEGCIWCVFSRQGSPLSIMAQIDIGGVSEPGKVWIN